MAELSIVQPTIINIPEKMARAISISHGVGSSFSGGGFRRSNLATASSSSSSSLSHRPSAVKIVQHQTYWANLEADIEAHLKKAIPIKHPVSVFEPMHHLTFAAPRTTAPALCIAACELVGGDREDAMAAAAAIHLMQAAAHAHQHLPLSDRPRPGPETVDHKFGPNIELLTADGIVPFGLQLLSEARGKDAGRVLRVMIEITRATGSQGLVEGLYKEMDVADRSEDSDFALIEYVCGKKEGELHGCAAACGAILGGGNEEEIEKLRRYGFFAGTVKGMMVHGVIGGGVVLELQERMEKLRTLAMKELESFKINNGKVDGILGLFESELSFAKLN